jgi:hypothetical protein
LQDKAAQLMGCSGAVTFIRGDSALAQGSELKSLDQLGIADGEQLTCVVQDPEDEGAESNSLSSYDAADHELVSNPDDPDGERITVAEYNRREHP